MARLDSPLGWDKADRAGTAMRVIAYCRVSSDGQEDGTSLDTQEAEIRAWAERGGHTVVNILRESASGKSEHAERPLLMAALTGMAADPELRLVVVKRSRLARNVYAAAAIEKVTGGRVVSLDVQGEGPEADLMRHILDAFSAYERAQIAWRCGLGRARRKAEGAWLGGQCPWGLRSTGGKQSTLVPDGNQQATAVAWVFAQRDDGATLAEIATDLNAQGHRTREGHGFTHQTVARILAAADWYRRSGVISTTTEDE